MRPLLIPALVLVGSLAGAETGKMTDAQVEAMAKEALVSTDPKVQEETLKRLQIHHFKSTLAKERELALYVQGTLEDRLGQTAKAASTFHRLEQSWPHSAFLPETQVVMAEAALEHKRNKEAEGRLRKALASSDLPAESVRRSQELLLWCLADQGRAADGIATVNALKPLGTAKPTEKGLVGIVEALCAAGKRAEALGAVTDYRKLYPRGPRLQRVDLAWARLLGTLGEAQGSAQAFQKLIQSAPRSPEADEARLALATLLTDGRLSSKEAQGLPSATTLLGDLDKTALKDGPARQSLLVKLRVAQKEHQWREAIDAAAQIRALRPGEAEALQVSGLRAEIVRDWTQELLEKNQATAILPYLDGEGIRSLTPAQRQNLAKRLAQAGLPEAAITLVNVAPAGEKAAIRKAALDGASAGGSPQATLALLASKGESPAEALLRAQTQASQGAWAQARAALPRATPGPARIQVLLALLGHPLEPKETAAARLKDAEGWLARAPEKAPDKEPLVIFTADLRTQAGDWRGALALYPSAPQPGNRGWVALMRATCQMRLGQAASAKATLKDAGDDPAYRNERQALAARLGA